MNKLPTEALRDHPALEHMLLISQPDCLLIEHWSRATPSPYDPDLLAAILGDLFRSYRMALDDMDTPPPGAQMTLEAQGLLFLIAQPDDLVVGMGFSPDTPLGAARLHMKRLHARMMEEDAGEEPLSFGMDEHQKPGALPQEATPSPQPASPTLPHLERPRSATPTSPQPSISAERFDAAQEVAVGDESTQRGPRLIRYLQEYAPDPHAVLLRVSLQTGIPLGTLRRPGELSADDLEQLTSSVKDILGLETLTM